MSDYSSADARRVVDEVRRQKKNASEYAGMAGQAGKTFITDTGIPAGVLSLAVRLDNMELDKRTAYLRDLIRLAHRLGHFDQIDAFDDLVGILKDIGSEMEGRQTAAPAPGKANDLDDLEQEAA